MTDKPTENKPNESGPGDDTGPEKKEPEKVKGPTELLGLDPLKEQAVREAQEQELKGTLATTEEARKKLIKDISRKMAWLLWVSLLVGAGIGVCVTLVLTRG